MADESWSIQQHEHAHILQTIDAVLNETANRAARTRVIIMTGRGNAEAEYEKFYYSFNLLYFYTSHNYTNGKWKDLEDWLQPTGYSRDRVLKGIDFFVQFKNDLFDRGLLATRT
ncbi:MAG: hypothetical protein WC683_11835 [bacterium]